MADKHSASSSSSTSAASNPGEHAAGVEHQAQSTDVHPEQLSRSEKITADQIQPGKIVQGSDGRIGITGRPDADGNGTVAWVGQASAYGLDVQEVTGS